ncbi:FHA domain-containing protein [Paraclostridium bifermentans]|uniref:FHA domain-containing protein n=1 Tax=Paraclostridium bifermentans TaxID=1490 RepID=UPI00189CF515|nr:FHA domain-containing protein [Paraclostridium bifermentans]
MNRNIRSNQIIENGKKYLVFNLTNEIILDFQISIINNNQDDFIKAEKIIDDEEINIKYYIDGYISLIEYLERKEISKESISNIVCSIAKTIVCCYDLSLSPNNNVLDFNSIFIHEDTQNVKLINLPLNDKYIKDINKCYITMIDALIKYVLVNSRIKPGAADELINIRNNVKKKGLDIVSFATSLNKGFPNEIEKYKSQIIAEETKIADIKKITSSPLVKNNNLNNIENNRIGVNEKMIESRKKSPTPPVSKNMPPRAVKKNNVSGDRNLNTKQKAPLAGRSVQNNTGNLEQANKVNQNINMVRNNIARNNNAYSNSENHYSNNMNHYSNNTNVKQKTQFKTSRIVASIIMQPIIIGLILLAVLVIAKTSTQAIGLGVFIAAIDIFVLAILLNPNKKEVIGEEIIHQQQFVNDGIYSAPVDEPLSHIDDGLDEEDSVNEAEEDINIIDEETNILDEETDLLNEDTDILSEETSLIEEVEPIILPDYILEVDNNEVVENIEVIHEENYVIGRQAQLQNYITNSGVSRRHVEIVKENDEFYVRDLKSKNGTRINNIRMASGEQKKLNNNDVIEIPDLAITFRLALEEQ